MPTKGDFMKIYIGEENGKRIKATTDVDCLSPQIVRFDVREMPDYERSGRLFQWAAQYEAQGYEVCIDTDWMFYETER